MLPAHSNSFTENIIKLFYSQVRQYLGFPHMCIITAALLMSTLLCEHIFFPVVISWNKGRDVNNSTAALCEERQPYPSLWSYSQILLGIRDYCKELCFMEVFKVWSGVLDWNETGNSESGKKGKSKNRRVNAFYFRASCTFRLDIRNNLFS